jgi:hypothetical protein
VKDDLSMNRESNYKFSYVWMLVLMVLQGATSLEVDKSIHPSVALFLLILIKVELQPTSTLSFLHHIN